LRDFDNLERCRQSAVLLLRAFELTRSKTRETDFGESQNSEGIGEHICGLSSQEAATFILSQYRDHILHVNVRIVELFFPILNFLRIFTGTC